MTLAAYADNYLTESLISPSSMVAVGVVPQIERFVAGSARMEIQGVYTDTDNRTYLVLISYADTVGGVYRYDWSDTGGVDTPANPGGWNAVDVVIVANVWQALSHGVQIRFIAGGYTPQLVFGDRFRFHVERPYRPALGVDLSRETEMRSGAIGAGGTYIVTFPFAVATSPQALVIFDHTIPSSATIRLQGSTTSNFAATPYNQLVTWAASKIRFRVTGSPSYAYWRLHITVVGAVDSIAWSEVYLGGELLFTKDWEIGYDTEYDIMGASEASVLVRGQGRYGLQPARWSVRFAPVAPADDLAKFETLRSLIRPTSRSVRPFFLWWDSVAGVEIFALVHVEGAIRGAHVYLDRYAPALNLIQVTRTAA